jgi:hypothetical protein
MFIKFDIKFVVQTIHFETHFLQHLIARFGGFGGFG